MPTASQCEKEIEQLHAFFVEWYCGTLDRDEFDRLEHALGESFERIGPDGSIHERNVVRDSVREQYDSHEEESFDIDIRNVELIQTVGNEALVRYEEWQTTAKGQNGRLSTVLLSDVGSGTGRDTDALAVWLYLQETWLEEPS